MKAFVLSILIACSLTACARSTPTEAQIDAQYNKLLVEYGNAELICPRFNGQFKQLF